MATTYSSNKPDEGHATNRVVYKCFKCNKEGHMAKHCPVTDKSQQLSLADQRTMYLAQQAAASCGRCGATGHSSTVCFAPPVRDCVSCRGTHTIMTCRFRFVPTVVLSKFIEFASEQLKSDKELRSFLQQYYTTGTVAPEIKFPNARCQLCGKNDHENADCFPCGRCGGFGHTSQACVADVQKPCDNCGQLGHYASACKNPPGDAVGDTQLVELSKLMTRLRRKADTYDEDAITRVTHFDELAQLVFQKQDERASAARFAKTEQRKATYQEQNNRQSQQQVNQRWRPQPAAEFFNRAPPTSNVSFM